MSRGDGGQPRVATAPTNQVREGIVCALNVGIESAVLDRV